MQGFVAGLEVQLLVYQQLACGFKQLLTAARAVSLRQSDAQGEDAVASCAFDNSFGTIQICTTGLSRGQLRTTSNSLSAPGRAGCTDPRGKRGSAGPRSDKTRLLGRGDRIPTLRGGSPATSEEPTG